MRSNLARVGAGNQDRAPAARKRVRAPKGAPERFADFHWMAHQEAKYARESAKSREERLAQRVRSQRLQAEALADGADLAPAPERVVADAADRKVRVARRLRDGFAWKGGGVGGNSDYPHALFIHHGLVSAERPVLLAFVAKLRRRRHLRVGGGKSESYEPGSKLEGLDEPYVEDNSRVCGVLRIETDHVLTRARIEDACRTAGVPQPNLVVGWRSASGYHRPHLIWLLHDSVPLEGKGCARFLGLYRGVLRGLTAAFLDIGADPAGLFNSHRHKNPLSPMWDREVLAEQPFDLGALKARVDVTVCLADLEAKAAALRLGAPAAPEADHPDPAVAAASNSAFRNLANWSREQVGPMRAAGAGEAGFADMVAREACRMAAALAGDSRKPDRAALKLAAKVAHWTWNTYRAPAPRVASLTPANLKAALAKGGQMACAARKDASFEAVAWAASVVVARDGRLRQAAVLELVRPYGITSLRTLGRHWAEVRLALKDGNRTFDPPSARRVSVVRGGADEPRPAPPPPAFLRGGNPRPRPPLPFFLLPKAVSARVSEGVIPSIPFPAPTAPPSVPFL